MASGNIDQQDFMPILENFNLDEDDGLATMSLVDHLEELRWRILKCLGAIAIFSVAAFVFHENIMRFLEQPLPDMVKHLTVLGIGEGFTISIMVSIVVGFICSLPIVLYQTWAFIAPGLYEKEKKHAVPFIVIGVVLFVVGISLGYSILHYPISWLIGFASGSFNELITAGNYFQFIAFFLLAFGVIFELPLVLTFLAMVDLITRETLQKKRAAAHIGMWLGAAIIMPGADPYTPVITGVSLSILYELTIIFIRIFVKK